MNTFTLQRAIRDDETLNAGEVAVLFVLTTYLPTIAPSVAAIANGCRLTPKSVRRILQRLDGRWIKRHLRPGKPTIYILDPPLENPPLETLVVDGGEGAFEGRGSPLETPPEETNKKLTTTNNDDTKISAKDRLASWGDVWDQVVGSGPLPSLDELRRWRPKLLEAHFSACLGEVANARAAGTVKAPRSLFFGRLKATIGKPTPTPWTKDQVLRALRPASSTSAPDLRRPDLQAPTITAPLIETPEQRAERRANTRASLEALDLALQETS